MATAPGRDRRLRRGAALAVTSAALGVGALTACGSAPDDVTVEVATDARTVVTEARGVELNGTIADQVTLDGVVLWVGSPTASEDDGTRDLLGAVTVQALEAAGATVQDERSFGSGLATRDALVSGEIDLYWEGIGQVWTVLLRQPADDLTATELHEQLFSRDLDDNGVAWLDMAAATVGPRFAVAAEVATERDVGTLSELAGWLEEDDEAVVCVTSAFITFPNDGRVAVEQALDMTLSDEQLRVFDPEPIYANTADGTCGAGLVMATSGRVPRYDLVLVEDDVGAFLPNPPAPAVRESVLLAHPQLASLLNTLAARLDTGALQAMNRSVVLEGRDPDAVASAWLREQGLTT